MRQTRAIRNLQHNIRKEGKNRALNHAFWSDDRRRINHLKIPSSKLEYQHSDTERLLQIENEFFTAVANFRRKDGIWTCIQADTAVQWLKSTPFDGIKNELLKRGCSWEWLPVNPPAAIGTSEDKHDSFTITSRTAAGPPTAKTVLMASTAATGETQGRGKLLDQGEPTTSPNSKCSAVPSQ